MNEWIVGIDLGTTNSELAVVLDGEVKVLPVHGNPIMPSCVGFDPAGKLLVGQVAKNQWVAAPESTVISIKRKMGENVRIDLGDRSFSPEEISSFILRELKQEGEKQLGKPISKAVITVPAYFNETQRKATQTAGMLAGLEVVRILNEPTAAALAYDADKTENQTLLVYDLGGGTFDVSVVVVESGVVEVKASHGDTHLGGDDFDQLLIDHTVSEFRKIHNRELVLSPQVHHRLKTILERAKCRLSDEPYVIVREEYIDGKNHLEMEITREAYERMITPLLEKTLGCVHQALNDAKFTPRDIHKVMLVGGATRTPLVHQLLQERLRLEPRFEIHPDLVVAMGAAIQASVLGGEKRHSILVDITPHTLSTAALGAYYGWERMICVPIIPRNTALPVNKAEIFYTLFDNQKRVQVQVYQGEGPLPEDNFLVGEFMVDGLSEVPSGNPVVLHLELDLNGMLKTTATEKNTGLSKSVAMDLRGKNIINFEEARKNVDDVLHASLSNSSPFPPKGERDEEPDGSSQELVSAAKDLRKRAEILLTKNISSEDAQEINHSLHQSVQAIAERNWAELGKINNSLSDLLFYLED